MKKSCAIVIAIILAVWLTGCASWSKRSGEPTEIHPGHVGHEIHN